MNNNDPHKARYTSSKMFATMYESHAVPPNFAKRNVWIKRVTIAVSAGVLYYWLFLKDYGTQEHALTSVCEEHKRGDGCPTLIQSINIHYSFIGCMIIALEQ